MNTAIWEGVKSFFTGLWEGIKSLFTSALTAVINSVKNNWNTIKSTTTTVFNAIKNVIQTAWNNIKSAIQTALNNIVTFVKTGFNNAKSNITTAMSTIKSTIQTAWNNIKSAIQTAVSNIVSTVKSKFSDMINAVRDKMNSMKEKIKGIWNSVKSFFQSIDLSSIGRNIIQGLINGISGAAKGLYNKAREIASNVVSKFKGVFDIHSPSKVFKWMGEMNGKGLEQGMQNSLVNIKKTADKMAKAAIPKMQKLTGNNPLSKYFNAILEDGDWMNDWVTHLPKSMQSMVMDVGKQFSTMNANDKSRSEEMARTKTTVQIPLHLNGNQIAYAQVDDLEYLLAQKVGKQNRLGGIKG